MHCISFVLYRSTDVVGIVVVAKTACKRDVATSCDDFALAVVVLAAQTVVVYVGVRRARTALLESLCSQMEGTHNRRSVD